MFDRRADRARFLAERYPASRDVLYFYAAVAGWQSEIHSPGLAPVRQRFPLLLDLVRRTGPPALADAAGALAHSDFDALIAEYWESPPAEFSIREFFARVVLQPYAAQTPEGLDCPWCRRPPQAGCLRPQGDGLSLELVCALCLRRRPFPRTRCPACSEASEERIAGYAAPEFPHLRLQACNTCRGYVLVVNLSRELHAIPEVDEMAGLPLDIWAAEQGYRKLQPNLAGI